MECSFVAKNGSLQFSTDNVSIMKQMQVFSPGSLMSNKDVTAMDIHELCVFYGFDPLVIATERQEFLCHTDRLKI